MTDKEFKRLSRAQLIDIIYQLQLQIDKLNEEKQALEGELKDKRLRLSNVGNIAEAALEMNDCLRSVQNAAEQYLNEIKAMREETEAQRQRILSQAQEEAAAIFSQAQEEAAAILSQAQEEAATILAEAKNKQGDYDSAIEAILKEYGQSHSDNG